MGIDGGSTSLCYPRRRLWAPVTGRGGSEFRILPRPMVKDSTETTSGPIQATSGIRHHDDPLFACLPFPAALVDEAGVIVVVNDAFLESVAVGGRSLNQADFIGRSLGDVVLDSPERWNAEPFLQRLFAQGTLVEEQTIGRAAGDTLRWPVESCTQATIVRRSSCSETGRTRSRPRFTRRP